MDYNIEKILQYIPFNTYDDLFSAIFNNKASIKLSNNACRQIVATEKPVLANFGIYYGIIPSAILTIALSMYFFKISLLLLIVLEIIFPIAIYFLNNLKIKTWPFAIVVVVIDLFFVELPSFVLVLSLSWLVCSWVINWWQKKVYILSVKILKYNKDAFEWAYNSCNLLIEDCYGNIYDKLGQNQIENDLYDRLLKILKIGAGVDNIDKAIVKFSSFYLKKGKEIPNELYWGVEHLSKQEKCENLLKILEIGTGDKGIENISQKLLVFYKSKGVIFPNDI